MTELCGLPDDVDLAGATVTVAAAMISNLAMHPEWLSDDELARARRRRAPGATEEFITVWSWVRSLLGAHLGVPPGSVPIARDDYGRPRLLDQDGAPGDFTISHAAGVVAVGIADRAIGIDVEPEYRGCDLLDLAAVVAHPDELSALSAARADDRPTRFARLWTRKEALLKAIGTGFLTEPRRLNVGTGTYPALHAEWVVADLSSTTTSYGTLHGAIAVQTTPSSR